MNKRFINIRYSLLIVTKKSEGLENKLEGVNIGSLLLLQDESGDMVAGFVRQLTPERVRLSHEAPVNSNAHSERYFPTLTQGDREYRLKDYNRYRVVDTNFTSE
jgi:hypothetical protein